MARLLHRTHLLCLLSRGLLYDQAASDALLQVMPSKASFGSLHNHAYGICYLHGVYHGGFIRVVCLLEGSRSIRLNLLNSPECI